jgi:hypothetical protein
MTENSNNPISALFGRIKSAFGKKPAQPETSAEQEGPQQIDALRRPSATTYSKLQALSENEEKKGDQPAFPLPTSNEQTYQASRGGAQATRAPKRSSSTYTKLQALSASGTGSANSSDDPGLNNLLASLDTD